MAKESHNFDHSHQHENKSYNDIVFTLFLNLFFAIIEVVAFVLTNSVTMYSSALHDFGDVVILFFTSRIEKVSNKKRSKKYTYGNRRFSLVGAIINVVILLISSVYIIYISVNRLFHPEEINANIVIVISVVGIIVNYIGIRKLSSTKSVINKTLIINLKSDMYNFIGITIGAIIIKIFNILILDALFSIVIAFKMLYHVFVELKFIFEMLMQAVPKNIDIDKIEDKIRSYDFTYDVHDIHIWTLDGDDYIMSFHLVIDFDKYTAEQIMDFKEQLKIDLEKEKINHTTIELDTIDYGCNMENRHENNFGHKQ